MLKDLQYKIVQDIKFKHPHFEAIIAAYDFPLVVDGDWNPYTLQVGQRRGCK